MKSRERLLAVLRGQKTDRIPWSPFLAYYWEHLPRDVQSMGQFAYLRQMGGDPLLRGFHHLASYTYRNCELQHKTVGNERFCTYHTPVGSITERFVYSPAGDTWFIADHPVKTTEDFKILQYIYEHTVITPDFERFEVDKRQYGDDALLLPTIGVRSKTAFQSLVEHWVGTVNLVYALYDEPEVVESCLEVMAAKDEENVRLSLNSSAEGFIFWEDSSTTNISPSMFEKYTKPEIDRWGDLIHAEGKLLVHHACGLIRDLIPLMAKFNIDAIESISPPPTGNITVQQAASMLPEHIALIGGL